MRDYLILVSGVACAGLGGNLFVGGALGLARWCRLSPALIAATFAAFATSGPEIFVSTLAALAGTPQIGLGDALGSNVVNVGMILAIALAISGIQSPMETIRRDFPVAMSIPVLTAFLFRDGLLSRWEGLLLLSAFCGWCLAAYSDARKQRGGPILDGYAENKAKIVLFCLFGLGLLTLSGKLIVQGAHGIATSFGIHEFIIGQTLVAVGTSIPELATTVIAKLRGHDEIGLGTLLGSNIFNGLFIVGVAALIHPIAVPWREVAVALGFGIASLAMIFPDRNGHIGRRRGFALLFVYGSYLLVLLGGIRGS